MTAFEKIPLMCIGTAAKPMCFQKHTGRQLGLDYFSNKKGSMGMKLFMESLERFAAHISGTGAMGKVVVRLDNCSADGNKEFLSYCDSVAVYFLP